MMNYEAPWWLPGGNLQTIYAAVRSRRYLGEAPSFLRERWTTPDDDFVDVDFAQYTAPQNHAKTQSTPGQQRQRR